jgi:hypothetical protein
MRLRSSKWLAAAAAAALIVPTAAWAAQGRAKAEGRFLHHVFFYLKKPGDAADKAKLVAALRRLSAAPTIRTVQIGEHAGTTRDVIERGYDVSWTLGFDNAADQEAYQVDPIHLRFVEENSALWSKVVVYDTVPVAR